MAGPVWPFGAEVVDGDAQGDGFADDAVAGGLDHPQAAVGFLPSPVSSRFSGAPPGAAFRHVVDLPVGDGDGAGQAGPGDVGQRAIDLGEQLRAGVAGLRHGDGAEFKVGQMGGLRLDRLAREVGQMRPVADLHGGRLVHHQQADIAQRLPRFLHQPGTGQPQQQHREGGEPQQRAAATAPKPQRHDGQRQHAEGDQEPHRHQRIEVDRGDDLFGAHQIGNTILLPSRPGVSGPSVMLSP